VLLKREAARPPSHDSSRLSAPAVVGPRFMRSLSSSCYTGAMPFVRREAIPHIPTLVQRLDNLLLGPLFERYWRHPPEIVHYTSIASLIAILESGNFRMSHFRYLNDSTELRYGREIASDLLERETLRDDSSSGFF